MKESTFEVENPPKLRNCPFCNHKAYLIGLFVPDGYGDERNEYRVGCENCDTNFQWRWSYDYIVDLWNGEYYENE